MASRKSIKEALFTWGDSVQIMDQAPPELRPGSVVSVCGVRPTEPKGGFLYLVEYSDGKSIEVDESVLIEVDDERLNSAP